MESKDTFKKIFRVASLLVIITFTSLGLVFARMSLDEILETTEKMLEDAKSYSTIIDQSIEEYGLGNETESRRLLSESSDIVSKILELSKNMNEDYDYYSKQMLSSTEKETFKKISDNLQQAGRLHTEATRKINNLGQLATKRAVVKYLASFSSGIERYRTENKKYPEKLEDLTTGASPYVKPIGEALGEDKYAISYKRTYLNYYELNIEPKK